MHPAPTPPADTTVIAIFHDADNGGYALDVLGLAIGLPAYVECYARAMWPTKRIKLHSMSLVEVTQARAEQAQEYITRREAALTALRSAQATVKDLDQFEFEDA